MNIYYKLSWLFAVTLVVGCVTSAKSTKYDETTVFIYGLVPKDHAEVTQTNVTVNLFQRVPEDQKIAMSEQKWNSRNLFNFDSSERKLFVRAGSPTGIYKFKFEISRNESLKRQTKLDVHIRLIKEEAIRQRSTVIRIRNMTREEFLTKQFYGEPTLKQSIAFLTGASDKEVEIFGLDRSDDAEYCADLSCVDVHFSIKSGSGLYLNSHNIAEKIDKHRIDIEQRTGLSVQPLVTENVRCHSKKFICSGNCRDYMGVGNHKSGQLTDQKERLLVVFGIWTRVEPVCLEYNDRRPFFFCSQVDRIFGIHYLVSGGSLILILLGLTLWVKFRKAT